MKFSFSLEGGEVYLLNSEAEILCFKSKLLEIFENLKSKGSVSGCSVGLRVDN